MAARESVRLAQQLPAPEINPLLPSSSLNCRWPFRQAYELNCSARSTASARLMKPRCGPAADARQVEEAFATRLGVIRAENAKADEATATLKGAEKTRTPQTDKSVVVFPEPRRIRDRDHVRHVMKQPCLICGRRPSDPHHLRFAQSRALGRKVSDEFTVPLCRTHHREIHRCGDERSWWGNTGIDPLTAARAFWLETHPLPRAEATTGNNGAQMSNVWSGLFPLA